MYINGRKITIEELERMAHKLIGTLLNDLYLEIEQHGLDIACPYPKNKQRAALKKMMQYYIEEEKYEKCAVIRNILKTIK